MKNKYRKLNIDVLIAWLLITTISLGFLYLAIKGTVELVNL